MHLSRRASWFLIAFAAWSWFIWVTLIKNIWADPRSFDLAGHPTGFLGIHVVLAVISITFGTMIGRLGWRGLQAVKTAEAATEAARETPTLAAARTDDMINT